MQVAILSVLRSPVAFSSYGFLCRLLEGESLRHNIILSREWRPVSLSNLKQEDGVRGNSNNNNAWCWKECFMFARMCTNIDLLMNQPYHNNNINDHIVNNDTNS